MLKGDTVIVLPAHNEAAAIGKVITDCLNACDCRVVVSASGCTDDTATVARRVGNGNVSVLEAPKGKGMAIQYAFKRIDAKKVIMLDADATYPPDFIPEMLGMLRYYDSVIGMRELEIQSSIDRWGNNFITRQAQLLYGVPIHDLCTGMWAFRGNVVRALDIHSYGFTLEAELFTQIVRKGFKLGQMSIPYYPRIGDKKINRLDHLRIMAFLWKARFLN